MSNPDPSFGLQAVVDGMNATWQRERSTTQMTLGQLIDRLQELPAELRLSGVSAELHSYRGYYCDLAVAPSEAGVRVADLLAACQQAEGETFTGWKGGDYVMSRETPVWVADEGVCEDQRLMAVHPDGEIETAPEDA